jgi:TPP-dependent pyruvate/acetoin dehydrogenase alpha subunit
VKRVCSEESLMQPGISRSAQLDGWRATTQAEVTSAIERAKSAPWPDVSTLFELV